MAPVLSILNHQRVETLKNVVFAYVVIRTVLRVLRQITNHGVTTVISEYKKLILAMVFRWIKSIPFVQGQIDKQMGKMMADLEKDIAPKKEGVPRNLALPAKGYTEAQVKAELNELEKMGHVKYMEGRVSGTVYHGGAELTKLITHAYDQFAWSNPLHPDVFPGVRKMDAEIVAMVLRMYNGGPDSCGTTTSGGTESILMACKAMRDWARDVKGITEPEIVVPVSAHAAFDKAGHYFNIKVYHAPVDKKSGKVDVKALRRLVNSNTVMIVGSGPSFPHGVIDDIPALAKIAKSYNIGLHVDCCLGGFLLPFMEKAGFPVPPFDFRVDGVTSISCDTHKYGFAPKGSSVIMYSKRNLRRYQYFVAADWPGGIYASPSIAGSRPGAILAGCWATMMYMGEEGYVKSTKAIVSAARQIIRGINETEGLYVVGDPLASVVAFSSDRFDIYRLGTEMTKRGWNLNSLQYPSCIHICCTYLTAQGDATTQFINDLKEITKKLLEEPHKPADGVGAIYGLAQAVPDRSMVDSMARGFIDVLYSA